MPTPGQRPGAAISTPPERLLMIGGHPWISRRPPEFLWFLAALSAYLGGFNLLPFPALDGGRLAFLAYEAVTRRKPNARVEANIHAFGLMLLIALITVVTFRGN